jgi:hypothetical protein
MILALEYGGVGLAQIDDDQAIDHIGKLAVEIERAGSASSSRSRRARQTARQSQRRRSGARNGERGWIRPANSRPSSRGSK